MRKILEKSPLFLFYSFIIYEFSIARRILANEKSRETRNLLNNSYRYKRANETSKY